MYRSLEEIEKNPWIIGIIEKLHATNTQTDAIRDEGGLEEIMSKSMPMIVPQPNPQQPQYAYQ